MNCKPGDMAIVIVGRPAGTCVTCVRLFSPGTVLSVGDGRTGVVTGSKIWELDRALVWDEICTVNACVDEWLLPIRPERDEDLERDQEISDRKALRKDGLLVAPRYNWSCNR